MEESLISKGIPLQVCDIFLQELNKVDPNISYVNLSSMLAPYLYSLANCRNRQLVLRIVEKIMTPILENNITIPEQDSDEEEDAKNAEPINWDKNKGDTWVDGGKLPPKTFRELQKIVDTNYYFPNFNILLFAQSEIFKCAQS
jgi:hypothetical protein